MNIAWVADSKQAAAIIAAKPAFDEVFCVCPGAGYQLQKAGYKVVSCAAYYGSLSHAKTALRVSRELEQITDCGAECFGLSASERSGFRSNLIYMLCTMYYFYYSTRHYKRAAAEFYFAGNRYANYDDVFAALLTYTLRRYNHSYENTHYSLLHYYMARWCNWLVYGFAGAKRAIRVVHFGESALNQIEDAVAQSGAKLWVFRPRTMAKNIAQTLHITLANLNTIRRLEDCHLQYFRTTRPADYKADFIAQTALFRQNLGALKPRFPLPVFFEHVVEDSGWYVPFLTAQTNVGANMVYDLAPHLIMTNKGKYHFIRAAVAALPKERGVGVLINHGTHTAQTPGTISQMAANLWGSDDRISFHNVSYVVPRVPLTAEQVKQIYTPNIPQFVTLPTIKRIARNAADPQQKMKIIFAGNYVGPHSHIPWVVETADEYLLGLLELVEKIGAMEGVEFVIKLKARKASMHIDMVQERIDALGLGRKVRIDTKTRFLDELADTHLVISNLSTTIEEALTNHVPVLLHSYRKHYFHLPDNDFIYGIKLGQDVHWVIEMIRRNYAHIVTNAAALDGIIWKDHAFHGLQELVGRVTKLAQ